MDKIKKGLGRGLSSLIGETKVEPQKNQVSISDLVPNKYQPRKIFDEASLEDLTNSIKERGMIQPIIVRNSNNDRSKFEIIAGERRWLAAQKAGLHNVPVVITEADDLKSLEFAIVENVQRHDLNPLEEAQGYKKLIDEFSYDQEKVSKFIGKSRSYITNCLRILTLPSDVLDLIETKKISAGHAKILVGLENASFVAQKIIEKKLSVRQSENFVKIFKKKKGINVKFNESIFVFDRNKHHSNISENSIKNAIQSDLSNLTIIPEKKFLLSNHVNANFIKPLLILASFLLLAFNVYSYISITDTNEYKVKSSRVQDVLNDLSQVYSEFSPGSVHEIRIQDGGKHARISLLDDKFDVSRIKEKLNAKYFVEFENINKPHVLILNDKGEGSD